MGLKLKEMKRLLFILFIASVIVSCQKSKESTENSDEGFIKEREVFFDNLQDPAEVAAQLQATAVEFNPALMNDPKKYTQYMNDQVKAAANLGVYLSDLNYSVAYTQSANTKELFNAAHELSKAVGIEAGVLELLAKRYADNLANNDSAKTVIENLYAKATKDLRDTDREKLVGIAMAGYQIENLHLASGAIESFPKDMLPTDVRMNILVPIFQVLLKQKNNVQITYDYLKSIADPSDPDKNPNYPYYANAYQELIDVYNRLNVDEKIADNQGDQLLSDAVAAELRTKIDAIRNKVVSAE